MVAYNKVNGFVTYLARNSISLSSGVHIFGIALTNTLPTSSMTTSTDITESFDR